MASNKLDYGLWVGHFSDQGYCRIYSEIINLKNKKLRYRKPNTKRVALDGKWDEDTNYPHLKKAVKNAITLVIQTEKQNLSSMLRKGTRKK